MRLFWLRRPHVPLLILLVSLLGLYPLVEESYVGRWTFNLAVVVGTLLALRQIHAGRFGLRVASVLGALAVATQALHWAAPSETLGVVSAIAQAGFFLTTAQLEVRYVLRDMRATVDELFSAAVAFLLLSLAWASCYWCIEYFVPGSFAVAHPRVPGGEGGASWYELLYFSITTLSTTGYGDIVPVSSAARSATMLEQLVGVLYVALIISRLVGFSGRVRRRSDVEPS
jgi:hypothetical protein